MIIDKARYELKTSRKVGQDAFRTTKVQAEADGGGLLKIFSGNI